MGHLRVSPVNGQIINWQSHGRPISCGCLPYAHVKTEPCCPPLPIPPPPVADCVQFMGWGAWLPEVIVGIDDPNEEIAANYVRQTAIEFAKRSYCLQRIAYGLTGDDEYFIDTFPDEKIAGVLGVYIEGIGCCRTHGHRLAAPYPARFEFNLRESKVSLHAPHYNCGAEVMILVYTTPTETALQHDAWLYEEFRRPVAEQARAAYVRAERFRDRYLLASVQTPAQFEIDIMQAKGRVLPTSSQTLPRRVFDI